jgi:DNA repair protein SbcD/Mre11
MVTFRFLHCADLHLDSPLRGLEADPEAPVEKIRGATREALRNLVDFAVNERVDFVLAAGDLYDGDWQDWRTGQFLIGQLARLTKAGISFIAIRGNHDAASIITNRLSMRREHVWLLDHKQPETFRLPNLRVAIHGQSFATRAVTENLARTYASPIPGWFNIGLLHSSVGERELHDNYAPCSVEQLRAHDYDYWALGHVHEREVLSRNPWIVFPGNLQGRHINEPGPKGGTLVTVTDGKILEDPVPVVFDTVRWSRILVVLTEAADEDVALAQIRSAFATHFEQSEGRLLAARVTLSGACIAHDSFVRDLGAAREKIKAEALAVAGPGMIWTETIEIATSPLPQVTDRKERTDAIGQLIRALEEVGCDDVRADVQAYAVAMLDKANPLRSVMGDDHAATKAASGEIPDDLRRRAQALLLGSLDG